MSKATLNNAKSEVINNNFLLENPDIPLEPLVQVFTEIPKMETITFTNHRDPGITLNFHYASKTHPIKHYDLVHGQQYTLPVEVIKHLEGQNGHDPYSCHKRLYGKRMRSDGVSEIFENGYVSYFRCQPVR